MKRKDEVDKGYAVRNSVHDIARVLVYTPGDLNTQKRTGTCCDVAIDFSIETTEYIP